ncbi:MAG: 50S ribosomal protein L19e [Nanoarchaeota archaeon]
MQLTVQRRIAAELLKCSPSRISFEPSKSSEIKEAITKFDIWALIKQGTITKKQVVGSSRGRARALHIQKVSGRSRGHGSRKGKQGAREGEKRTWMNRIRKQRALLKELKDRKLVDQTAFRDLYNKAKGGYFRSTRHVKLYLDEHNMIQKKGSR